jgi:hypothetical protein
VFPSLKGFDFGLDGHLPSQAFRLKPLQIARFHFLLSHFRGSPGRLAFFDISRHNWAIHPRFQQAESRQAARNHVKSPFPALR